MPEASIIANRESSHELVADEARRSATSGSALDGTYAIEAEVRAETDRLLLVRTKLMLAMIAVGISMGFLTDAYLGRLFDYPIRNAMHIAGVAVYLGLLGAFPYLSRHFSARFLAFVGAALPCPILLSFSTQALSSAERMNLVGYTVVVLGTAILLPWGIWAQAALTGVVVLTILAGALFIVDERFFDPGAIPAIIVACGLSYFVAYVLEKNRLTLVRQRHALAAERELAERRRVQAEALAKDLDAYAHTVAHDLKTPVFVISGYNDLLRSELDGKVSETAREFLDATGKGCEKMTEIINEILLLASVRKSEDVARGPLDMAHIVAEARTRLTGKIEESGAEIAVPDIWPQAVGHPPWVEAVWTNYISNAIKYGGSPPRIDMGADRRPDGSVHFWVRDNGEGLGEEQLGKVFDEFSRTEPTKAEGHGLGLSIVRRVVEALGGEVTVESRVGEGSTFGFTLPQAKGVSGAAGKSTESPSRVTMVDSSDLRRASN